MYKLLIACLMIVSLKAARVLEKQEVKCKVSMTKPESENKEDGVTPDFKVDINCEDLDSKKKMTQNLTCKAGEEFKVLKVDKAAVQNDQEEKQVKTDDGETNERANDDLQDGNDEIIDSKINGADESEPQNQSQSQVQSSELKNKKRILTKEQKTLEFKTYELAVGEHELTIENYSLQSIDKLEGCQVLVKGSLINQAIKVFAVLALALF